MDQTSCDSYISMAFVADIFILILFLPLVLGHFVGLNGSALRTERFVWPHRGWMLVLSCLVFLVCVTIKLCFMTVYGKAVGIPTMGIVHTFLCLEFINLTAALLQVIALLLVSIRQTRFSNIFRMIILYTVNF